MIDKLPKISTSNNSEPVKHSNSNASVKSVSASSTSSKRKTLTSIYEDVMATKNSLSASGNSSETISKKEVC